MRRWRRGEDCSVRQCVAVAHASLSPSFSSHIPLCSKRFIVSARMHRYRRRIHRSFRFFSTLFFAFSSLPPLPAALLFFFYFPTIIILSNFAHSKRWRKFVEVTPRKMWRIPCRVKPRRKGTGWLFICYEVSALPRRKRRRGFECIYLLNAMRVIALLHQMEQYKLQIFITNVFFCEITGINKQIFLVIRNGC